MKPPAPIISDVSQLLEKVLLKELPIKKNGIEISFEQPSREWSSRLNGPTLNLFLYDLRKNKLRQAQWETRPNGRGKAIQQRAPLRFDLNYMMTAWVLDHDPDEEHYLLTAALLALSRHPQLPDPDSTSLSKDSMPENSRIDKKFLPKGLQNQPGPISLLLAEPDELLNPADVWSALDNELRPSIACTVTISIDPFQTIDLDLVRRRELKVGLVEDPTEQQLDETATDIWPHFGRDIYQVEGAIYSNEGLEDIRLAIAGRGIRGDNLYIPLTAIDELTHEFTIDQLTVGYYKLEILARDRPSVAYDIIIPAEETEIKEKKGGILLTTKIKESNG